MLMIRSSITLILILIAGSILYFFLSKSKCLAKLDNLLLWLTKSKKMFFEGYGDILAFEAADKAFSHETVKEISIHGTHKITLEEASIVTRKVATRQGYFTSPIAKYFSPQHFGGGEQFTATIHQACFEMVLPLNTTWEQAKEKGLPVVILLPSTGDEGYGFRRMMLANPLAANHGFVCLILESPFYGQRRIPGLDKNAFPLSRLEHVSQQALGLVMESITLMKWLREDIKYTGAIGFAGISLGGSMSSLTSLFCPYDHAVISLVPSNSRRVYVDGGMAGAVDFTRFGPIDINGRSVQGQEAAQLLLDRISVQNQSKLGATNVKRVILQTSAEDDVYIPKQSYALPLYEALKKLPSVQYIDLKMIPGGHISAILVYPTVYVARIVEGMGRMSEVINAKS